MRPRTIVIALVAAVALIVGLMALAGGGGGGGDRDTSAVDRDDPGTTTTIAEDTQTTEPAPPPDPVETTIPGPPTRTSQTLEVGDCFNRAPDEQPTEFRLVPCDQPHTDEVYTVLTMRNPPGARYPRNLDDLAEDGCYKAFVTFMGVEPENSDYAYDWYTPTEAEWGANGRRIPCVVTDPDGKPTTGSAADAKD